MEKVLDNIQKRWQAGPLQGNFEVNNDLRASELRATSDYNLMDEQVALATAAAAAAMAMEHEHHKRPRSSLGPAAGSKISNQERLRALAAGLPQQRERVGEVLQGMRERAPEVIQEIRERTPEVIQGIRERTPEVLQGIRERTPEVLQEIREFVRDRILQSDSYPPQHDFDATGRAISNTAQYNNSLNEEEPREQPPNSLSGPGHRIRGHCNQAWKNLYQAPKSADAAEYYVNFDDGNARDAVSGAMSNSSAASSSRSAKPVGTGYADMNDPLDVSARHPPLQALAEQATPSTEGTEEGQTSAHSATQYEWGAIRCKQEEEEKEVSAFEEEASSSSSSSDSVEPQSPTAQPLHSTANYQWGAVSPQQDGSSVTIGNECQEDTADSLTEESSGPDTSASDNEGTLVDISSSQKEDEMEQQQQQDLLLPEFAEATTAQGAAAESDSVAHQELLLPEEEKASEVGNLLDLSSPQNEGQMEAQREDLILPEEEMGCGGLVETETEQEAEPETESVPDQISQQPPSEVANNSTSEAKETSIRAETGPTSDDDQGPTSASEPETTK